MGSNFDAMNILEVSSLIDHPFYFDSDDILFLLTILEDDLNLDVSVDDLRRFDLTKIDGFLHLINHKLYKEDKL